jgi:hypothetical protein
VSEADIWFKLKFLATDFGKIDTVVNVPPAKVESMYDPESFALSATQKFSTK